MSDKRHRHPGSGPTRPGTTIRRWVLVSRAATAAKNSRLLALCALVGLQLGSPNTGRAEGFLERLGGSDAWDALGSSDPDAQVGAIKTLLRTGGKTLCKPLFGQFTRFTQRGAIRDTAVSRALIRAFGTLGCRNTLAWLLHAASDSKQPRLSREAIGALGRLRHPQAIKGLVRLIETQHHPKLAVAALARYGPPAVPVLVRLLSRGGPVVVQVAPALAEIGTPAARNALRRAIRMPHLATVSLLGLAAALGDRALQKRVWPHIFSPDRSLRELALAALERIADRRSASVLLGALGYRDLRERALALLTTLHAQTPLSPLATLIGSAGEETATQAVEAVGHVGGARGVPLLAALLRHRKVGLREAAVSALQYTNSPEAAKLLLGVIAGGAPEGPLAAIALGSLLRPRPGLHAELRRLTPPIAALLVRRLRGPDRRLRRAILIALGRMRVASTLPVVLRAFEHGDLRDRRVAVEVLGQFRHVVALPNLIAALRNDRDPVVRAQAAWSLGKLGSELALKPLWEALQEATFPVAASAAAALARIVDPDAGHRLAKALSHTEPYARANVATALAKLGYRGARARLLRLARRDPVPVVRVAAVRALGELFGKRDPKLLPELLARETNGEAEAAIQTVIAELHGGKRRRHGGFGPWVDWRWISAPGHPIAWQGYALRLPDGFYKLGVTNSLGWSGEEGLSKGVVDLRKLDVSLPPTSPKRKPAPPKATPPRATQPRR